VGHLHEDAGRAAEGNRLAEMSADPAERHRRVGVDDEHPDRRDVDHLSLPQHLQGGDLSPTLV
jgi:hypothetical protein